VRGINIISSTFTFSEFWYSGYILEDGVRAYSPLSRVAQCLQQCKFYYPYFYNNIKILQFL